MSEQTTEQKIQDKGLNAPRLNPTLIDEAIKSKIFHVFEGSCLTICCLTLQNGFTVSGESACASPENFNEEIGQDIAFKNARDKIWMLEGYLLKQKLFEGHDTNTFVGRLYVEHSDLRNRINKLQAFVLGDKFESLPQVDRAALKDQLGHMSDYFKVLGERVSRTASNA